MGSCSKISIVELRLKAIEMLKNHFKSSIEVSKIAEIPSSLSLFLLLLHLVKHPPG